ncbi:MAG: hypothetical protein R2701_11935 [Acidimicrobiales bacterium]
MESTSLQFAAAVRSLSAAARARGLAVPSFRSPPRRPGFDRTVRRRPDGSVTISVAAKGRPFPAVVADLIEGVVVVNDLTGAPATRERTALWEAVLADDRVARAPARGAA